MNTAEAKLRERLEKLTDPELVDRLLASGAYELSEGERVAFSSMRALLFDVAGEPITSRRLSSKQRRWALDVLVRVTPIAAADVPRGKEVVTPEVLRRLPKKPPGRAT